jgi:PD-(D/E)XK endonuclease
MKGHRVGDYSEALALAKFFSLGWDVSKPVNTGLAYDFIVNRGHGLIRVQVKTGRIRRGCVKWYNGHYVGDNTRSQYDERKIDLMVVVCLDNFKVYALPIEVAKNCRTLRLEKARQPNGHLYLWGKDFEL